MQKAEFASNMADPWWRINNLYYIKDKDGNKIKFNANWAQRDLYENIWYNTIILKARQLGMTTLIQLMMLDKCLFTNDVNCGVVAHNKDDAEAFFRDKIKYAYDNLPDAIKKARPARSDTTKSLVWAHGSSIRVGTSLRSGTFQHVHISEFGKLCAKYPDKAKEVITGTLNTVGKGNMVTIESTAEGPFGDFYTMCQAAEEMALAGDDLTMLDYKFFFYPWWKHPDYRLSDAETRKVDVPQKVEDYFEDLAKQHGIECDANQIAWYTKKQKEQGQKMKQEYPSTSAEAFERSGELAIYGEQLKEIVRQGRRTELPHKKGLEVHTFWDLGRNDKTAIWFMQDVDNWYNFIYYFDGRLQDLIFYVRQLHRLRDLYGWIYGTHYLPHDAAVVDLSSTHNKTREMILNEAGLTNTVIVPKVPVLNDAIDATRIKLAECKFDREGTEDGWKCLRGYEWAYDERHETTRNAPVHNWASNGADAFRQFTQGYDGRRVGFAAQAKAHGDGTSQRKYASGRTGRNGAPHNPTTDHIV